MKQFNYGDIISFFCERHKALPIVAGEAALAIEWCKIMFSDWMNYGKTIGRGVKSQLTEKVQVGLLLCFLRSLIQKLCVAQNRDFS